MRCYATASGATGVSAHGTLYGRWNAAPMTGGRAAGEAGHGPSAHWEKARIGLVTGGPYSAWGWFLGSSSRLFSGCYLGDDLQTRIWEIVIWGSWQYEVFVAYWEEVDTKRWMMQRVFDSKHGYDGFQWFCITCNRDM